MSKSRQSPDGPAHGPGRTRRRFLASAAGAAVGAWLPLHSADAASANVNGSKRGASCAGIRPLDDVAGKVAFITGASSGIGLGIARAFFDSGMKVVIGYRTQQHLDDALPYFKGDSKRVHAINVDVTDRAGMEKAAAEVVATFGKVHVLVNNAGVQSFAPLAQTSSAEWDWVLSVNVTGVFNGVRSFLPHLSAHRDGGQIISIASVFGLFTPSGPGLMSYATSKYAVVGMMEAMRGELESSNIGVSVCCPGWVPSMLRDSSRNRPGEAGFPPDPSVTQWLEKNIGDPELTMDPLKVGELVLRGMRNNDLYILTHPEYAPAIRDRNDALVAASPGDVKTTAKRVDMVGQLRERTAYRARRESRSCTTAR